MVRRAGGGRGLRGLTRGLRLPTIPGILWNGPGAFPNHPRGRTLPDGSMDRTSRPLTQRLRQLHAELGRLEGAEGEEWSGVAELRERLERDLLPRTAGGHEHLVVGIVGPNNAGKSSLFNALVAGEGAFPTVVSPAEPTGGATRRLVGALSPSLRAALEAEPTMQRFDLRTVESGPGGVQEARETAPPGAEAALFLVDSASLPDSLLLVDTPDFDSVLRENRAVTDALLAVADVAVVVVTRHTYQNHDVIEFLSGWLEHGRPWVLVYNESIDDATTRAHGRKVEQDLGQAAEATFAAAFDPAVARGEAPLAPRDLRDPAVTLAGWLRGLGDRGDLKQRAMEASLRGLREDLAGVARTCRTAVETMREVHGALRVPAIPLGRAVAREAMPMGPFLQAFREVLDERPTQVQRDLRRGLRWTGDQLAGGLRWARRWLSGGAPEPGGEGALERTLLEVERAELERRWAGFYEPAQRTLQGLARSGALPGRAAAALAMETVGVDLPGPGPTARGAFDRAAAALALDPELLDEHRSACREIIREELDRQGSEAFLQLAVDVVHLLPLGLAGVLIVHTGGLGTDVAMAGGGAAAAALAERLSRTLGTGVALAARSRWTELRAGRIADAALAGLLGPASEALGGLEHEADALSDLCERWGSAGALAWDHGALASDGPRASGRPEPHPLDPRAVERRKAADGAPGRGDVNGKREETEHE